MNGVTDWRLSWGDHVWTAADVTVGTALAVRELLGTTGGEAWGALTPVTDPRTCAAFLAVLLAQTETRTVDDTTAEVMAASALDLVSALDVAAAAGD